VVNEERKEGGREEGGQEAAAFHYYLDDGVYGSLSAVVMHGKKLQPYPLPFPPFLPPPHSCKEGREGGREIRVTHHLSTLWGPTCDGLDCVEKMTRLPEMEVGGWVAFLNVGALPFLMRGRTCFNGLEGPQALHCFSGL